MLQKQIFEQSERIYNSRRARQEKKNHRRGVGRQLAIAEASNI
jgi:hypothetical protein